LLGVKTGNVVVVGAGAGLTTGRFVTVRLRALVVCAEAGTSSTAIVIKMARTKLVDGFIAPYLSLEISNAVRRGEDADKDTVRGGRMQLVASWEEKRLRFICHLLMFICHLSFGWARSQTMTNDKSQMKMGKALLANPHFPFRKPGWPVL
jgi:hypothetical protein